VPEFWLSTDKGLQVPVIPLDDEVGSEGTAAPPQIVSVVPKLKVGKIVEFTVTATDVPEAHWPEAGVKV
jgi:hypothetical protein